MIPGAVRRWVPWLVLVGVALVIVVRSRWVAVPAAGHTVVRGELVVEVMGTGTLEARVKTTVSARIQERVAEVLVDEGDAVEAGQLLVRLDDAESRQQAAIAAASLEAARQTATRVRADLDRADAVLAQARLDAGRINDLVAARTASQSEADKAAEALRVAEADLKRAHAAIAEADGQVVVAQKTLLFRQEQLAFTEIRAPYAGLVIRRDRDPGDVLVPGASILQLISLRELWVRAWVDETAVAGLAADQPARVVFRSEPGRNRPGRVSRIGRETDRETREFLVDVRVGELPPNWTIGQRAEVFIETGRLADAVLIPPAFIVWKAGRSGVLVNEGGRARWREVSTGAQGGGQVAITSGLEPGDQVVRAPAGVPGAALEGKRLRLP